MIEKSSGTSVSDDDSAPTSAETTE